MFSSLKVRNFRIYWLGMLVSLVGTWIQAIAQSWLVYQLTHSAFLLGVVGFLSSLPIFFLTLFAGAVADRVNKRTILLITQNAFMVLAVALALLTQLKFVRTWHIMVIALGNGICMAFDAPCRQALVVELVGKEYLMNAIALNSVAFNSARIIGPAVAGICIAAIGMSGCFYLNAASFLAVIVALCFVRIPHRAVRPRKTFFMHDILEGLRFMKNHSVVRTLIVIMGIMSLFGLSYVVLMPVFVERVLRGGVRELGILMSTAGFGALVAALMLARLGNFQYKGRLLLASLAIFSLGLLLFSFSTSILFAIIALLLAGFSSVAASSLINTLLQTSVPDSLRGRVMSGFMFTFAGIMPFGNLLCGVLAQKIGVALAVRASALACAGAFMVIASCHPQIQDLK